MRAFADVFAFRVVYAREVVFEYARLVRAVFDAQAACDTADRADASDIRAFVFGDAEHVIALRLGGERYYLFGACFHAEAAGRAFFRVNEGDSVFAHLYCSEGAGCDAVAEAQAPEGARFVSSGEECSLSAGGYSRVREPVLAADASPAVDGRDGWLSLPDVYAHDFGNPFVC